MIKMPAIHRSRGPIPRGRFFVARLPQDTMPRVPRIFVHGSRPPRRPPVHFMRTLPRFEGITILGALRGDYRVADTTIEGYELYRGVGAEPDLASSPWETFTALPHDTAALSASTAYRFVLRYRNRFGLVSQNQTSWKVTSDGTGAAEARKPSDPFDTSVEAAAGGAVRVRSNYMPGPDGTDAATIFAVWVTSDGADPDPDVDAVTTTVSMTTILGLSVLDWTSGAYADALTIKVVVRSRRVDTGPVNVDSSNTDVFSTISDTDGPGAPGGGIFHGESAEEGQ